MSGILLKLQQIYDQLKPSERKIAKFILNYPEEVINMSITELALKSGTSNSAVVRLCKTLNYNGYREMIVAVTTDIATNGEAEDEYTDIQPGDDLQTIIRNVCHNNKKSIEETLQVLSYQQVEKAVDAIVKTKRIDFYGVGASGIICMDACQKFQRIHKICYAHYDYHMQLTSAATLHKGDVAVIISYSGNTKEVVDVMRIAKQSGATVIGITKYGKSIVSEEADIVLSLSSPETSIRSGAMGSRIAQLNVVDIIFSSVASREYKNIKKYLDITHKVVEFRRR